MRPISAFLGLLLAFFTVSAPAGAQASPRRIGVLGAPEEPRFSEVVAGLKEGLREVGYPERAIEVLQVRVTRKDHDKVGERVKDLVRQRVEVLFLIGSRLVKPARQSAPELPFVVLTPGDPVAAGLVSSLSRPGDHMTALTFEYPELSGKRLELIREMLPEVRRVLALYDPRDPSPVQSLVAARQAAPTLGIALTEREARSQEEIERGLELLGKVDALLSVPGGFPTGQYREIIGAANAKRVPTMFHARTESTEEALATYGTSDVSVARQAARLIDKILKGTNAGTLPVERPTKLELVINLKVAKQIGVTIPASVLARADRVIR